MKCKKSNTAKVYEDKKGRWRNPDGTFAKDPGWPDNFGFVKGKDKIGSLDVGHKVDRFLGILVETLSLMQERLLLKDLYRAQV